MSVLYSAFPLALLIVAIAVAAYVWATRIGQLKDLKTRALRMLHDDSDTVHSPRRNDGSPERWLAGERDPESRSDPRKD